MSVEQTKNGMRPAGSLRGRPGTAGRAGRAGRRRDHAEACGRLQSCARRGEGGKGAAGGFDAGEVRAGGGARGRDSAWEDDRLARENGKMSGRKAASEPRCLARFCERDGGIRLHCKIDNRIKELLEGVFFLGSSNLEKKCKIKSLLEML